MALLTHMALASNILKSDPKMEMETLSNGMTIVVYKNVEPPQRASMRLLVRRGSAVETESERGLAHFIEHMAFNGTKHFPSGDMVEYFQRLGMAFGADTNAHTGFTETVYKLDMPDVSEKLMSDGLLLLRDYADGILFDPEAIERERGVIIAEKNSRDDQDYRKAVKEIAHYFKGTVYAERMPIGVKSVIENAKRENFLKYYRQNYRPENMILVVVGDVVPAQIFSDAEKIFADMKPYEGELAREENFGNLEKCNFTFNFDAKELPIDIEYDRSPNSPRAYVSLTVAHEIAKERDAFAEQVKNYRVRALVNAITSRFLRIADDADSPISQGAAINFNFDRFSNCLSLSADAPIDNYPKALEELFRQLYSFQNVDDAEIENAKKKIFDIIESNIKSESTRKTPSLANSIVSTLSDGEVFTDAKEDMRVALIALKDFNAAAAIDLLKEVFSHARIKIFISDVDKIPTKSELEETAKKALSNALQSLHSADKFRFSGLKFSNFGKSWGIEKRAELEDIGITQVVFKNGVRLNLKKTDFAKDEIIMKISFGNGFVDIPLEKPEYYVAINALMCGGTKFQNVGEISAAQYLLKMNLNVGVEGNSFFIYGRSSIKDFETMARFSATIINDAGFRNDGEVSLKKYGEAFYRDFESDPMARARFLTLNLIESPKLAQIPGNYPAFKKLKMEEIARWLNPILKNSYMEISLIGDIDIEKSIELFSATFASLPPRMPRKVDPYVKAELYKVGTTFNFTYKSDNEPRSIAMCLWQSGGREQIQQMRAANLLGAILDDVLRKEVREKEGKVYSPFAYNNASTWLKDIGFMCAATFVVPEYNKEISQILKNCAKIVEKNITQDEFERAKIPLLKSIQASKRKNAYWLEAFMNLSQVRPLNLELARSVDTAYDKVTLDEVRALARQIFAEKAYEASVMPAKK